MNFLRRKIYIAGKGVSVGTILALMLVTIAIAAFVNLQLSGSVSGTAGSAKGAKILSISCNMQAGIGTCVPTLINGESFSLALADEDDESIIRIEINVENANGGTSVICLAADPTGWSHGSVTETAANIGQLMAVGSTRNVGYDFGFESVVASQDLTANIVYPFAEESAPGVCP